MECRNSGKWAKKRRKSGIDTPLVPLLMGIEELVGIVNGDGGISGDGDMAKKMNGDGDMAKKMNGDGDEDPPFEPLH